MTKVLKASCVNSVVTCEGQVIDALILSEGIGDSEGVALIDKEEITYLTSNAKDIKLTLNKLNEIVLKITVALTAINANMVVPPPTLPSDIAELTMMASELVQMSEVLK